MPKPDEKPFVIPRSMVWEAWRRVKANKGAPGVDGQDLAQFEADLRNDLYKVWNRMSSGSYFPPPGQGGGALQQVADRAARKTTRPVRPPAPGPLISVLIRRAR